MTDEPATAEQVERKIAAMQRTSVDIETERARLTSAMNGVYRLVGWPGLLALVADVLTRMALDFHKRLPLAFRNATFED